MIEILDQYIITTLIYQPNLRIALYFITSLLALYFFLTIVSSRNFILARFKKYLGRELACCIDIDGSQTWITTKKKLGSLITKEADYEISPGSVIRGADCDFYLINKELGRTLPPEIITAANRLRRMGYKHFSHALLSYQADKHAEDYKNIVETTLNNKGDLEAALVEFNKKVYTSLNQPHQTDYFTKNLAVLYNWSNQKLSAYVHRQVVDEERIDVMEQNAKGGWTSDKVLGYVVAFVMLLIGAGIALAILQAVGIHVVGGGTQTITTVVVPTTLP